MDEVEYDVSRDRYNEFVQEVQRDCIAFGFETRIHDYANEPPKDPWARDTRPKDGSLHPDFQVFWNEWQTVARERDALTERVERTIYPATWHRIVAEAAVELARS